MNKADLKKFENGIAKEDKDVAQVHIDAMQFAIENDYTAPDDFEIPPLTYDFVADKFTVKELKAMAKEKGIEKTSRMKEPELIKLVFGISESETESEKQ